ncbi:MAG: hypothetical protein MN733_40015, partial [Nitrososphaera sp.]|nr:hypothetical protein [Nitrososphaera sp.]
AHFLGLRLEESNGESKSNTGTATTNYKKECFFESMLGSYQENTAHGVVIVRPNTDIREYADICRRFLGSPTKSVWSMSDIGLDLTFDLFANRPDDGNQASVLKWIEEVNTRAKDGTAPIDVKRIQVITEGRGKFFNSLDGAAADKKELWRWTRDQVKRELANQENDNNMGLLVEHLKAGWERYKTYYVAGGESEPNDNIKWYVYNACNNLRDQIIRGEYIIFDGKYLVRYHAEARTLEIVLGEIVERFARPFRESDLLNAIINDSTSWGLKLGASYSSTYNSVTS